MTEPTEVLSTGIPGLDRMLRGGIPRGHVVAVIGAYGTGKTTLGLHFIYEGLRNGEKCIVMSFDEDEDSILKSARSLGMDLEQFSQNVQVFRLEAEEVRNSLTRIESDLFEIISGFGTSRILIDTISVLETLFDEGGRYKMLATIRTILKSSGVTAIITSESDKYNPSYSKYGLLEYVCDGLICLRVIRASEMEEPTLGLEVVKMRRVNHSRTPRPYTITDRGISVFEEAEIF